jgi:hypothetical protein
LSLNNDSGDAQVYMKISKTVMRCEDEKVLGGLRSHFAYKGFEHFGNISLLVRESILFI